ncbi:MAG TPA: folate-binding protein [Acidiphilium sp.]
MTETAFLAHRGIIAVDGADRVAFLQGLVSNDVSRTAPGHAVWCALLTPQGRYLAEFFIFADGDSLLLDAPRDTIPDLVKRLNRFRLRSKVTVTDRSADFAVHAAWNGPANPSGAITAPDPRLDTAGTRILARTRLPGSLDAIPYLSHRLTLGLPDHTDLEPEKTLLMEAGFGELHGIDWDKGCYMGQELTARTRYRGLVKRRLVPVNGNADLPPPGTPITAADRTVGEMRTSLGPRGLAMLRLDGLDLPLHADTVSIETDIPAWMILPARSEAVQT